MADTMNRSSRLGSSMDSGSYLPRKSPRRKDDEVALLSGAVQRADDKAKTPGEDEVGADDSTPTSTLSPPSDDGSPKNSFARDEAGSKENSVPPAPDVGLSPPALRPRTTEGSAPPQQPPSVPLEVADVVRFIGSDEGVNNGDDVSGVAVGGRALQAGDLGVVTAVEMVDETPTGKVTCFFARGEVALAAKLLTEANAADPEPEPPKTFWARAFGPAAVVVTVAQLQEKQMRRLPYEVRKEANKLKAAKKAAEKAFKKKQRRAKEALERAFGSQDTQGLMVGWRKWTAFVSASQEQEQKKRQHLIQLLEGLESIHIGGDTTNDRPAQPARVASFVEGRLSQKKVAEDRQHLLLAQQGEAHTPTSGHSSNSSVVPDSRSSTPAMRKAFHHSAGHSSSSDSPTASEMSLGQTPLPEKGALPESTDKDAIVQEKDASTTKEPESSSSSSDPAGQNGTGSGSEGSSHNDASDSTLHQPPSSEALRQKLVLDGFQVDPGADETGAPLSEIAVESRVPSDFRAPSPPPAQRDANNSGSNSSSQGGTAKRSRRPKTSDSVLESSSVGYGKLSNEQALSSTSSSTASKNRSSRNASAQRSRPSSNARARPPRTTASSSSSSQERGSANSNSGRATPRSSSRPRSTTSIANHANSGGNNSSVRNGNSSGGSGGGVSVLEVEAALAPKKASSSSTFSASASKRLMGRARPARAENRSKSLENASSSSSTSGSAPTSSAPHTTGKSPKLSHSGAPSSKRSTPVSSSHASKLESSVSLSVEYV